MGLTGTSTFTLIGQKTDEKFLGRTFSAVTMIGTIAMPIALFLSSSYIEKVDFSVFFILAAVFSLISLIIWLKFIKIGEADG